VTEGRRVRLAVAAGGAVGALLRAGVSVAMAGRTDWPAATLLVNLTGAFALGLLLAVTARRPGRADASVAFFGTGLLGAYTTFSALAVETVDLLGRHPLGGLAYAVVSVAGGLLAAHAGRRSGARRTT